LSGSIGAIEQRKGRKVTIDEQLVSSPIRKAGFATLLFLTLVDLTTPRLAVGRVSGKPSYALDERFSLSNSD
jgi:hypothetical protein